MRGVTVCASARNACRQPKWLNAALITASFALLVTSCEASKDGGGQNVGAQDKKPALEFSMTSRSGMYSDVSLSNQKPATSRKAGGNNLYEADETPPNEQLDTLLKYAIQPVVTRQEISATIYEDGTVDLTAKRLETDETQTNGPPDLSKNIPPIIDIREGQATAKSETGEVIYQDKFEMPDLKPVIDSMKAELERGETNGEATASLNQKTLSLFCVSVGSSQASRMLFQAKEKGATIEKLSNDVVKMTFKGFDALGLNAFGSTAASPRKLTPFAGDPSIKVHQFYNVKNGRNLGMEMEKDGESMITIRYKYPEKGKATGVKLFGMETSILKTFRK